MNTKSQTEEILQWLQSGNSITPLLALEKFGCFRLGGRIFDLREQGHLIATTMIEKNGKHFASYSLRNPQELQRDHEVTQRLADAAIDLLEKPMDETEKQETQARYDRARVDYAAIEAER